MVKNIIKAASLLSFIAFIYIIFSSNQLDWDYFYTTTEADLRSLLVFGELPLWSYQFCAGVTRLGDPQALSLSPLFIFPLIWGPIWGIKIMMLVLFSVGTYFAKKILELFFDLKEEHFWAFAIAANTSNFFVWHSIAGHVTFSLFNLGLIISYYYFKEGMEGKFNGRRFLILCLATFTLFSGAFYPVLIYYFFPLIPLFVWGLIKNGKKLKYFYYATFLGLFLSSYKWFSIITYQISTPRSLEKLDTERSSLLEVLQNLISPSNISEMRLWGPIRNHQWSIWEYSFFSGLFLLFLFIIFLALGKKETFRIGRFGKKIILLALLPLLLSLGYFSIYSPYAISNHYLFSDSLRVHSRFLIPLFFIFIFFLAYLWDQIKNLKFASFAIALILSINVINLLYFATHLSLKSFDQTVKSRAESMFVSQRIWITPTAVFSAYPATTQGFAVANCYNPLNRKINLLKKMSETKEEVPSIKHFLVGELPTACLEESYFTSNKIIIAESCPRKICVNFNDINTRANSDFIFNDQEKAYCRQE